MWSLRPALGLFGRSFPVFKMATRDQILSCLLELCTAGHLEAVHQLVAQYRELLSSGDIRMALLRFVPETVKPAVYVGLAVDTTAALTSQPAGLDLPSSTVASKRLQMAGVADLLARAEAEGALDSMVHWTEQRAYQIDRETLQLGTVKALLASMGSYDVQLGRLSAHVDALTMLRSALGFSRSNIPLQTFCELDSVTIVEHVVPIIKTPRSAKLVMAILLDVLPTRSPVDEETGWQNLYSHIVRWAESGDLDRVGLLVAEADTTRMRKHVFEGFQRALLQACLHVQPHAAILKTLDLIISQLPPTLADMDKLVAYRACFDVLSPTDVTCGKLLSLSTAEEQHNVLSRVRSCFSNPSEGTDAYWQRIYEQLIGLQTNFLPDIDARLVKREFIRFINRRPSFNVFEYVRNADPPLDGSEWDEINYAACLQKFQGSRWREAELDLAAKYAELLSSSDAHRRLRALVSATRSLGDKCRMWRTAFKIQPAEFESHVEPYGIFDVLMRGEGSSRLYQDIEELIPVGMLLGYGLGTAAASDAAERDYVTCRLSTIAVLAALEHGDEVWAQQMVQRYLLPLMQSHEETTAAREAAWKGIQDFLQFANGVGSMDARDRQQRALLVKNVLECAPDSALAYLTGKWSQLEPSLMPQELVDSGELKTGVASASASPRSPRAAGAKRKQRSFFTSATAAARRFQQDAALTEGMADRLLTNSLGWVLGAAPPKTQP